MAKVLNSSGRVIYREDDENAARRYVEQNYPRAHVDMGEVVDGVILVLNDESEEIFHANTGWITREEADNREETDNNNEEVL